jgi:arsenate reductase
MSNTATLFGIRNCDTCRKALKWLEQNAIEHHFHDVRSDGLDTSMLKGWMRHIDWDQLVNRRSTTWRSLPENQRDQLSADTAIQLLLDNPTLLKRPLLAVNDTIALGFDATVYARTFGK